KVHLRDVSKQSRRRARVTSVEPVGQPPEPGPRFCGGGVPVRHSQQVGQLPSSSQPSKLLQMEFDSFRRLRSERVAPKEGQEADVLTFGKKLLRHLERDDGPETVATNKIRALRLDGTNLLEIRRRHCLDGPMRRLPREAPSL